MEEDRKKPVPDTRTLKQKIRQQARCDYSSGQTETLADRDSGYGYGYHQLLVQLKSQGIRGRIKCVIFYLTRFLTLWQEQFNRHIQQQTDELAGSLNRIQAREHKTGEKLDELASLVEERFKAERRLLFAQYQDDRQGGPGFLAEADRSGEKSVRTALSEDMYLAFEKRFRGSRSRIREQLSIYWPVISADFPPDQLHVLDIGCGRGEWLQYLGENGARAKGVDLNQAAVNQCRQSGLAAETADAMAFLQSVPEAGFQAVTGFHIIEHMAFAQAFALMDEIYRVLAPGGTMIFETPNPTNLLVSACDFYRDPGHIRPVHPDTALFAAQYRGFEQCGIYLVEQQPGAGCRLVDFDTWRFDVIAHYIEIPRDYALIARKPATQTTTGGNSGNKGPEEKTQ